MSKWRSGAIYKAQIAPFELEVEDKAVIPRAAGLKVGESWRGRVTVNSSFRLDTMQDSASAAQRALLQRFIEKCDEWKAAAQELLDEIGADETQ